MTAPEPPIGLQRLTPRQIEVLELMAKGLTNKEIGGVLGIAFGTVRNHVSAVIEALDVTNRTEAAVALQEMGLGEGADRRREERPEFRVPGFGERPAIAVLPFDNLSSDPGEGFLADGIVEDLITRLAQWRWYPVIARNSTFVYKDRAVDVTTVSRELGARYVIEGSVRRGGDRIRVTAQLLDGSTGQHVWAERYECELGDVFALQDEIVLRIVGALDPALTRFEGLRSEIRDPATADAWMCFHRATHRMQGNTREGLDEALGWLARAQDLDPDFSQAWAGAALCHGARILFQVADSPMEALAEMGRCGAEAMRRDPSCPLSNVAWGMGELAVGRRETAGKAFERAVEILPSFVFAHLGLTLALRFDEARIEDAIRAGRTALRLSPRDSLAPLTYAAVSTALVLAQRWEEALDAARHALALDPTLHHATLVVAACEAHLGRDEEARAALELLLEAGMSFHRGLHQLFSPPRLIQVCEEEWAKVGFTVSPDAEGAVPTLERPGRARRPGRSSR